MSEDSIQPAAFKDFFYSQLIQRMFYDPQVFKHHQKFQTEKLKWQKAPALHFSFAYDEDNVPKRMEGMAVFRQQKLIILFYLCAEDSFNEELAKQFINSLSFYAVEEKA